MAADDITVAIPAIPPRVRSGMLDRALRSVWTQERPAAAISVAVDLDRQGAPATRQRALDAVRTEWVAFLDDDDELESFHLKHLLRHAMETDADFVFSWFRIAAYGRIYDQDTVFPPGHYLDPWDDAHPRETTITVLVRTGLAKEVGFHRLPDRKENTGEDWGLVQGVMKAGGKISHLVEKTWLWHHDSGNTSGLPDRW